jgi:hypothetical protein
MKNKAALVAGITVISLVLGIGIAKITGYWRTESSKVPTKITEGEFAGQSDPGDIRGSYSFADIEKSFAVPPEMLAAAFGLTGADPSVLQAKSLEDTWGTLEGGMEIGTDSVRLFTALWIGIPYEAEATTALPAAAVDILEAYGRIETAKAADLRETAIALPNEAGGEAPPVDHEVPDRMVRGLTTFGDLKSWGVTEEMWMEKFGEAMGSRATGLKEWAEDTGRSMSEIKTAAQELVDSDV